MFGFDTAVIAGANHAISQEFSLTPATLGLTVSIALWGTVLGATCAGFVGQNLGGRETLRLLAVLYVVSALGSAFSWSWSALLVARFLGGLAIGGSSVLGPVYIAELSPAPLRGRLVGLFQINIVVGILLAYFSNYCIAELGLGNQEWRWQLGISGAPALLFLFLLFVIPRSPRWLVIKGRVDEARQVLEMIGSPNPDLELQEIIVSVGLEKSQRSEPVFVYKYRYPLFLAVSIAMFNQMSGINAILYYLNDIFAAAGFNGLSSNLQAVAVGLMNLLATILAMTLIDKLGRKTLLLVGSIGTAGCLFGVSAIFLTNRHQGLLLWLLLTYIAFFAISQGAVIWVYLSEVFPTAVRAKGQGVGSSTLWIMNALISGVFPLWANSSRGYTFLFFSSMMALQFLVVLYLYPETKQISLEQLPQRLGIQ